MSKSFNIQSMIDGVMAQINEKTENLILEQLNDLISRNLLVVELGPISLVQTMDSTKVEIKRSVRLVLKDKEYIEKLELENATLIEKLELIRESLEFND